ncbi:DinB family protein [Aneurinibacillus sp. Ricciae_BoGa-3]|uniref:DinB family protein n=1 Tax=Aneurinibacillus sp. Ricciae_BoGa-3 TaxID=3022697 RepID=UPI00233FEA51|nr:DinB family protein [Aneurinibacillus sp. Ricciae_BoGa-3]WCK55721.1 DinB family protein [Aneurinibacillus sp. Ricciae_BoGa-3]
MFLTIDGFFKAWTFESASTQKILDVLTDESLKQSVKPNDRTLGGIAWHIVTCLQGIMGQTGLTFNAPSHETTTPTSANEIAATYRQASQSLIQAIKTQWTDETLTETCNMFGQFDWAKGFSLSILINHQIHHRGQMTILMRQANLIVPGVYGPAKEEWDKWHGNS